MCEKQSVCVSLLDMLPASQSRVPASSLAKNIRFTLLVERDTTTSCKLWVLCMCGATLRELISDLPVKWYFSFFLVFKLLTPSKCQLLRCFDETPCEP